MANRKPEDSASNQLANSMSRFASTAFSTRISCENEEVQNTYDDTKYEPNLEFICPIYCILIWKYWCCSILFFWINIACLRVTNWSKGKDTEDYCPDNIYDYVDPIDAANLFYRLSFLLLSNHCLHRRILCSSRLTKPAQGVRLFHELHIEMKKFKFLLYFSIFKANKTY